MSDTSRPNDANRQHSIGETQLFTDDEYIELKRLARAPEKPLWRNYPLLVSILAFLLSLTTSAISVWTAHRKNINDEISQLSIAIQTISELNLKQVEVHRKYQNDPYEIPIAGLINAQMNNTLSLATDLSLKLGDEATTSALSAVGVGVLGNGDIIGAQKLFEYGLSAARTANDEGIALRNLAVLKILHSTSAEGKQEGEKLLLRASTLETKYSGLPPEAILWLKATAFSMWATVLAPSDCGAARIHFADARKLLESPLDNLDLQQLRSNMGFQTANGIGGVPSCKEELMPVSGKG